MTTLSEVFARDGALSPLNSGRGKVSSLDLDLPRQSIVFGNTLWLFVALLVPKLVHLRPSTRADAGWSGYLVDLAVATSQDALFALGIGVVGGLLIGLLKRDSKAHRIVQFAFTSICTLFVLYALVSVYIFATLRAPLTYSLIYLAGDLGSMRSSIAACASTGTIVSLICAPLAYVLIVRLTSRHVHVPGVVIALVALIALGQGIAGHVAYKNWWRERPDRRLAENPHIALLWSCSTELLGLHARPLARDDFPREDLLDFQPPTTAPAPLAVSHRPKNVIFCVLESVAAQHLGVYGSKFPTTPILDREVASSNAIIVDRFYSHVGISATSLAAMSLSTYPPINWKPITQDHPDTPGVALPQVLKQLGYRTLFVTSTDFTFAQMSRFLVDRGFDQMIDCRQLGFPRIFSWGTEDRHMIDRLVDWIDENPSHDQPFFAMTWSGQTHHPYVLSAGQSEQDFSALAAERGIPYTPELHRYLNALHETDAQLGRLFAALRERGIERDTVVVIIGDHGEAFGWPHPAARMHGQQLFEENLRVPCVIWSPGLLDEMKPLRALAQQTVGGHIDINPTILHLMGIAPPREWVGRSLLDASRSPRAYFFAVDHDYMLGMREENWKYLYNATTGEEQLFDLASDPLEQSSVADANRARCERLRQRLSAWLATDRRV